MHIPVVYEPLCQFVGGISHSLAVSENLVRKLLLHLGVSKRRNCIEQFLIFRLNIIAVKLAPFLILLGHGLIASGLKLVGLSDKTLPLLLRCDKSLGIRGLESRPFRVRGQQARD